jgi:hypothetical protein
VRAQVVHYLSQSFQLIVGTRYDVRLIDVYSGNVRKIYADVTKAEEELAGLIMTNDSRRFCVAS